MKSPTSTLLLALAALASAKPSSHWHISHFTSLVAFGDSYTDESRLGYFGSHAGAAPPTGWVAPQNNGASSGGRIWARYVSDYTGAKLYNYAVSGAVCSNEISPRIWDSINANFPSVLEYEVPAFLADLKFVNKTTRKPYFSPPLKPDQTVYSIWIGTNDLGGNAFLTDSQVPGYTVDDYVSCVYAALDKVYRSGARRFVLMNNAPLERAPLYSPPPYGEVTSNFWPGKEQFNSNLTEISYKIGEYAALANALYDYRTPFEARVADRYPGAAFAVFDTHRLMNEILDHPARYLNGTGVLDVTGFNSHCDATWTCTLEQPGNPDAYAWYDSLHPSEQVDRVIAREFVKVVGGRSSYAKYW